MPVRLTVLMKKKSSIPIDEFNRFWSEHHSQVYLSNPGTAKHLIKYSQFHISPEGMQTFAPMGLTMGEWDGAADFWGESYEDILAVFQTEEYKRDVIPDEDRFIDREKSVVMVGYDEVYLREGAVAEGGKPLET